MGIALEIAEECFYDDMLEIAELDLPGVDDKLSFGKYKDRTVAEVLQINPQYIWWAHHTVSFFSISDELHEWMCERYMFDADFDTK